jgi:hypothetical protein
MPLVDLDPTNEVGLSALAAAFVRPESPWVITLLWISRRSRPAIVEYIWVNEGVRRRKLRKESSINRSFRGPGFNQVALKISKSYGRGE